MDAVNLRRVLRVVTAAASGLAIAVSFAIAAPGAQAAGSLTGPSSAGVSQSVTVTLSSPSEGVTTLRDTANNQQVASVSVSFLGVQDVSFVFMTPSAPTTMVLSAYQGREIVSSNNLTLTVGSIGTTTTISAPNTAKVGTSTKITVTVT